MKRTLKRIVPSILLSMVVVVLLGQLPINLNGEIGQDIPYTVQKTDEQKALEQWIDKLEVKELDFNYSNRQHCVLDTNGLLSCGCLQFQERTFDFYSKTYDFNSNWNSCEDQKHLAFMMIWNDWNNWYHWTTSVSKIGKPPIVNS